jgi:CelD/BcsL family acetyltransferase involved in cellulose biosynthesis
LSFFENICARFAPLGGIEVGLAEYEGNVIAASLNLIWGDVWYYKFAASITEHLSLKPNEMLAWESMVRARQRGCTTYDWGVSDIDQPGLIEYKRKFASDERSVAVLCHSPAGHSNLGAAEAGRVLGEMTRLFTRDDMPDTVTQRAGEILYRFFT